MQIISYEAQTTDVFNLSGIILFVNIALLTKTKMVSFSLSFIYVPGIQ